MKNHWLREEKGFSLVELVLVVVVAGIVAVIFNIGLNSLETVRLNNATSKVIADLRYAQQMATTTRSRHGMTALSNQKYQVYTDCGLDGICGNGDDTAKTAGVDTPIKDPTNLGANFDVDFDTYQQQQFLGVRFDDTTLPRVAGKPFCPQGCGACQSQIEFNGLGAPTDTSGNVYGCNVTVVLTKTGAANQTVTIEQNTGRVN